MNSSNFDKSSEVSDFNKFKRFLYKYYSRFSKISKSSKNLNQCLVLLYDCMPRISQLLSINKLLRNAYVSQLGMVKNPTTSSDSETTKPQKKFDKKRD